MTVQQSLYRAVKNALETLGVSGANFVIEFTDLSNGDFATNAAMATAKDLGKSPREVAEMIVAELEKQSVPEIQSMSIAGPGFINFALKREVFTQSVADVLINQITFDSAGDIAGKKILIEHSSPNLFKPFHIGHMMNNAIGESLVRMYRAVGAGVTTMSFPSDISLGVAKAIYTILEKYGADFIPTEISVLGDAYVDGTRAYDEDESIHERVKEIADNLYGGIDSPELNVFNACKKFNIEYFESITQRLGSHFDSYIYESEAGVVGKDLVQKNTPAVFTESEGAIVYIPDEAKKYLNTSVFINSQGNPTYDAKDLGLLQLKFGKHLWDASLFVTDHEQIPHFQVVLDAAEQINPVWSQHSVHIAHGRMSFKGNKMSSRLGGVPLVSEILETVGEEVRERAKDRTISQDLVDEIAIAAIKFSILRAKPGQNINFDPDTSLSFEGDSGPYLQYTHARITTMLEKAAGENLLPVYSPDQGVSDIERIAFRFRDTVAFAVAENGPHHIVIYLLELARAFNSFYATNKFIDPENREVSAHRLAIAQIVQQLLAYGLDMLGIKAPNKM